MKLKFQLVYDTETKDWFVDELIGDEQAQRNNARIEHSGASYLRVKVGNYQIGTISPMGYSEELVPGSSLVTLSMEKELPDYVKESFK